MKATVQQAKTNYHQLKVTDLGNDRFHIECVHNKKIKSTITKDYKAVDDWRSDPEEQKKQVAAPPVNRKKVGYEKLINEILKASFKR